MKKAYCYWCEKETEMKHHHEEIYECAECGVVKHIPAEYLKRG